ncbi:MAG: methylenetetrahydrofolate reductase C-terminal domain-containing protein [Candidatus Omnitrophica bacterium]|nr:methylenetetrahydrofolate reductase C-terminal domain-containing protein [Candidatus Omnitrophota bacterium]MCM8800236.1 methylenetetrahydrofolate reductase C-terminal domain-containing protein [Candidatus Omnitrophota bacterium]
MIITEKKPIQEIIEALKDYQKIFLVGCGECSTTCKTGGEKEVLELKDTLIKLGKDILGYVIPKAPCIASQLKQELAKSINALKDTEAVLVLACGLGVQSVKDNNRFGQKVIPACNSSFIGVMDSKGDFLEKCSLCGDCLLDLTEGLCPITLCSKGILNGPCGGMDKGKCEVDKEKDCAWVLIYREMEKRERIANFGKINPPRDFKKTIHPRKISLEKK